MKNKGLAKSEMAEMMCRLKTKSGCGDMNQVEWAAKLLGVTREQVRSQYVRNVVTFEECITKALASGKMYRGQTADEWKSDVDKFKKYASGEE